MSVPALRQPKGVLNHDKNNKSVPTDNKYVMITLKGDRKLVVTVDAYNGILSTGDSYKCVFCGTLFDLERAAKKKHICSKSHLMTLKKNPHVEEFSHNLVRKLTDDSKYCTICNVVVANVQLMKHICSEVHLEELEKAEIRALTYLPHK